MYGVVSLLDDPHDDKVEAIWSELQARFGVHGVSVTPIAHFSYHVARGYDLDGLSEVLTGVAAETAPFSVKTTGLGIFTGADPVLYIPVRLRSELVALQQRLWDGLAEIVDAPQQLYHPGNWQPHITLIHKDVDHELLPQVVRMLSQRDFSWTITVDNLACLGGDAVHGVITRVPFGG
jgi:hypothetical protein